MATQCPVCKGKGNVLCPVCSGKGNIEFIPKKHPPHSALQSIANAIIDDPQALSATIKIIKNFFGWR